MARAVKLSKEATEAVERLKDNGNFRKLVTELEKARQEYVKRVIYSETADNVDVTRGVVQGLDLVIKSAKTW